MDAKVSTKTKTKTKTLPSSKSLQIHELLEVYVPSGRSITSKVWGSFFDLIS